ncbi:BACON domain-containing protein [uncultured Muribaculum sp.]|uniref:BACON domain-containing protein n=1 Tax=uncultured Muribaculum sp. TaxID=1918613 RepID=UPI0025F5FA64|nr:BACON domain-containing protein [uncultured Muribaculum sp.]
MKHLDFLSIVLCAASIFPAGCSSDDDKAKEWEIERLTADVTSLSVPAEGGTYEINIGVTGNDWKSIVPKDSWLTLGPNAGHGTNKDGHYRLMVNVAPNPTRESREESICIYTTTEYVKINVTQAPLIREESCAVSEKEIRFDPTDCTYRTITVSPYEEVEISLSDAGWLQFADMPETAVGPGDDITFSIAPDGPYTQVRKARIDFIGKESGKITSLDVIQQPIAPGNSIPSRWYYTQAQAADCGWTTTGIAPANYDAGANRSYMTAVGVNNRRLNHVICTTQKNSVAVSGLYTGDYLLFSIPSENLQPGTDIDFMLTISSAGNSAPKYWICEIYDGNGWTAPKESDLHVNADGEKYSFYTKYFSSYQHAIFAQTFTLRNAVTDRMIRVRCRVVGDRNGSDTALTPDNTGEIYFPTHEFHFCSVAAYPGVAMKDVKKVGIIGNSFTHYFASPYVLKELARSQGHELDLRINSKGSQYFSNHLTLERSKNVYEEGGYDYVLMQEQSVRYADYAKNPDPKALSDCRGLSAAFRAKSPAAKIILENTWAFPSGSWNGYGSSEPFLADLLAGTMAIASADDNVDWVSPIGVAFENAAKQGITDMYYTDKKHPNRNGIYLKSCVNYLVIFGERFNTGVSDCGCDPAIAAKLRTIAEETVLGHESEYFINR